MTLGQKIKSARLEAGLSQRQLCGDVITRNMLSQIENGSANPSMATLQYLASRLEKNISFFLQEQALESPNAALMQQARQAYGLRRQEEVLEILENYQVPDPLFDEEQRYLYALAALDRAENLLAQQAAEPAALLLERIDRGSIYYRQEMERVRRQLLLRAYESLEETYRLQKDFEKAYDYACKVRTLQR